GRAARRAGWPRPATFTGCSLPPTGTRPGRRATPVKRLTPVSTTPIAGARQSEIVLVGRAGVLTDGAGSRQGDLVNDGPCDPEGRAMRVYRRCWLTAAGALAALGVGAAVALVAPLLLATLV